MRWTERDQEILQQLWRCGGVATTHQLAHQDWDQGNNNSRFRHRLSVLAQEGYIAVEKMPRTLQSLTLMHAKFCYVLKQAGGERIGRIARPLSEIELKGALLKSEVARQLAVAGYAIQGHAIAGVPENALYLTGQDAQMLLFWCSMEHNRPARGGLKKLAELPLDPSVTSLLFAFSSSHPFVTFSEFINTHAFRSRCPFECIAIDATLPLSFTLNQKSVPFRGWYRTQIRDIEWALAM